MKVLRSRLYEQELEKKLAADSLKRNSLVASGDRSAKIRTYNYPQGRVTEHRIGMTLYDLQNVINGDIHKIIDGLIHHHISNKSVFYKIFGGVFIFYLFLHLLHPLTFDRSFIWRY